MIRILHGDCRTILATLPDASVQCCVTSPPYFGLRDYGTAQWDGGDAECDHKAGSDYGTKNDTNCGAIRGGPFRDTCGKCGARRIDAQIGLEASPDAYIAEMVAVFREVRRVLRDDGTLWLNLGDSYNAARNGGHPGGKNSGFQQVDERYAPRSGANVDGLAAKQLLMMPARVALALQADGWWLRSDIIWHKPNPMPESVTDRPTSAHEHVFLLTKNANYFFDADAVREEAEFGPSIPRDGAKNGPFQIKECGSGGGFRGGSRAPGPGGTRNIRNVWTIATAPFPDAHFATFPPELAERCIKAGTSERGCCANCGAPWVRQIERIDQGYDGSRYGERVVAASGGAKSGGTAASTLGSSNGKLTGRTETTGWIPSCQYFPPSLAEECCRGVIVPCTVLDPFAGAFTAPMVADRLQRNAVGIELSPTYCEMARDRLIKDAGMFAEVA